MDVMNFDGKNQYFTPFCGVIVTDERCAHALALEISYLRSLEAGRLLAGFYENSGIRTAFVPYGGWEEKLIAGHTMGHYLSALAQAATNAGVEKATRAELLKKLQYIVKELAFCQEHTLGKRGFLWAAPRVEGGAEAQFDNVERGRTNIKREAWVPWYTMHKILAGLLDAYRLAGLPLALTVAEKLGDWAAERALSWDAHTRKRVLAVEYGGMNDALYTLYSFTGNPAHARAAHVFDEEPLFDEILRGGRDVLKEKHANTTVPKILGALNRYLTLHERTLDGKKIDAERYLNVARAFFDTVVERHTYVTGGSSEWERFGADYVLDAERTNCNCETCITYNMLKLSRALFCLTGEEKYVDYYDNAFTNSILPSQNPETGMTTYFQPMAGGFFKVFSRPFDKFWCCTGSGMENFTKLGDSAFFRRGDEIFIEQYLAARVDEGDVAFTLECDFPMRDRATLRLTCAAAPTVFRFRIPDWASESMRLAVNGKRPNFREEGGHIAVELCEGDELTFRIPVTVTLKGLPDGDALAFRYGGVVLSADLGTEEMEETETGVDVTIPAKRKMASERIYFPDLADVLEYPEKYLVREGDSFRLTGGDVSYTFLPHYRRYRERYAIYFRLCEGARGAEEEAREPIDSVLAGYGQYEADGSHALEERNSVGVASARSYRYARAGGYFCYDFEVGESAACTLQITLLRADNGKPLRIFVGGEKVFDEFLMYTMGEEEYSRRIAIPAEILGRVVHEKAVNGTKKRVVTVRFEGAKGRASARVCGAIQLYAE